jgi:hypothetical protein
MISPAPLPSIPASVPGQSGSGAGTALLALDSGTCTGWALRERGGRICSGSQPFRPQRFEGGGMRFLRFHRWLTELIQASAPSTALAIDQVVFEEVRRQGPLEVKPNSVPELVLASPPVPEVP